MLLSISGAGALVGSAAVVTLTEFPRKGVLQAVAGVGAGVGLILLGVWGASFGYGGAIAAVVILGLAFTAYQTLNNTLIIGVTDVAYQGRVMSIYMLTFSMMPLMAAPLGVLADVVGATQLFVIQGAMIVVFMLLVTVTNPAVHSPQVRGRVARACGACWASGVVDLRGPCRSESHRLASAGLKRSSRSAMNASTFSRGRRDLLHGAYRVTDAHARVS